jgi:hypothetical protein
VSTIPSMPSFSALIYIGSLTYHLAIGFNVETVMYKNIKLILWDLGVSPVRVGCYLRLNNVKGTK